MNEQSQITYHSRLILLACFLCVGGCIWYPHIAPIVETVVYKLSPMLILCNYNNKQSWKASHVAYINISSYYRFIT